MKKFFDLVSNRLVFTLNVLSAAICIEHRGAGRQLQIFFSAFQVDLLTRALLRMDFQSPRNEPSSQLCHPLLLLLIFFLLQVFYVRSCGSCDRRQTLIGYQLAIAYSPEFSTHQSSLESCDPTQLH